MSNALNKTLDQKIDKTLTQQKQAHAIKYLLQTLNRLGMFKGLQWISVCRIESDEEWRDMGCPDADYFLRIYSTDKTYESVVVLV